MSSRLLITELLKSRKRGNYALHVHTVRFVEYSYRDFSYGDPSGMNAEPLSNRMARVRFRDSAR
jgi:hypothetical protein